VMLVQTERDALLTWQQAEKDDAEKDADRSGDQGLMDLISMAGSSAKALSGKVDKSKAVKGKK
jgi:hypothetical protein